MVLMEHLMRGYIILGSESQNLHMPIMLMFVSG